MNNSSSAYRATAYQIIKSLNLAPFVNGAFVETHNCDTIEVTDPMTGDRLCSLPAANTAIVNNAIFAARNAFDSGIWSQSTPNERSLYLNKLADLIDKNFSDLAILESIDTGKPISSVRAWDIANAAEVFRYYASWADKIYGEILPAPPGQVIQVRREPIGVCVALPAWNFPFPNIAWKLAPALATGCTIILKSAERAPLSCHFLARLIAEAGFPDGVINIISGGPSVGTALVSDCRIDKISFTGSSETARDIVKASAHHLPRLTLELGGKNPTIVCDDADQEKAISATVSAMFSVQGQNCCAGSRTFVHQSIFDQFLEGLVQKVKQRRLGDPLDNTTEQGPQIDKQHTDFIGRYVAQSLENGAQCATGGSVHPASCNLYTPTVLTNVRDDMPISRDEIFGPVGCVYSFADIEEVIVRANDTQYGLSASIWTKDYTRAEVLTQSLRVGVCWVNDFGLFETVAPWGGIKQSGQGRELGRDGLESYLNKKTVYFAH